MSVSRQTSSHERIDPAVSAEAPAWDPRVDLLALGVFAVAFFVAYRYGMSFSQMTASPFWFPDSVLLCALLLSRPRQWWVVILVTAPIRVFTSVPADVPAWFLVTTFAIDSGKGLLTASVLRRSLKNPIRIDTMRDFAVFCLVAVLLIPAASACLGAAARHLLGHGYWSTWEQWFLGNALTHLTVTPAVLYWVFTATGRVRVPRRPRWAEGGLLAIGLLVSGYLALGTGSSEMRFAEPRFYVPIPFLFWAAMRFGMLGASGAVVTFAALAVHAALTGRGPFAGQTPAETAIALQHFLLLRAVPVYVVAVLTEEGRAATRSLRESEERFRNMADTAPVLLWMSGVDKLADFFNRGWLEFTGRSWDDEIGSGWTAGVHPDDLKRCLDLYWSAFDARQPFEIDYRLRRHDGEYRWILARGAPRHEWGGAFAGYIGSAIDITDRKRDEEAQSNLAHAQRLAGMGQLTAMVAHEISQPIFVIMNSASAAENLMSADPVPLDDVRARIGDISASSQRAADTIRRVRSLSRRQPVQMAPLDINELVSDLLKLMTSDILRRRVHVRREFTDGLPAAHGDRGGLEQVALNLILNGMDAMAAVPEHARYLTIRTSRDADQHLEVTIADSGVGIAPDHLPRLFEAFFSTKAGGLGLGLSIARSIVDAHQGRIWAENAAEGGATFHFTVPSARMH